MLTDSLQGKARRYGGATQKVFRDVHVIKLGPWLSISTAPAWRYKQEQEEHKPVLQ